MASLEIAPDQEEKLIENYKDIEWVDDVTEFKCNRCEKVLVQHCIANCKHKFCFNCKKILGDGSKRWRCPKCKEFIMDIEYQDPNFRDQVKNLKLHCPHHKYGCKHVCALKELNEHIKECKYTKESALPVLYKGPFNPEVLELRAEVNELKRKLVEIEKKNKDEDLELVKKLIDENVAELKLEVDEMRFQMNAMDARHRDEKLEMGNKLKDCEIRIQTEVDKTSKLNEDIIKIKVKLKNEGSLEDDNKSKITKLEGQLDSVFRMLELHSRKNYDTMHQLKNEFTDELKEKAGAIQQETDARISTFKTEMEQTSILKEKQELLESHVQSSEQSIKEMSKKVNQFKKEMDDSRLEVYSKTINNEDDISFAKTVNNKMKKQLDALEKYFNIIHPQIRYFNLAEKYYELEADFTWAIHDVPDKITKMQSVASGLFAFKKYPFISTAVLEFQKSGAKFRVNAYKNSKAVLKLHLPHRLHLIVEDRDFDNDDECKDQIIICHNMWAGPREQDTIEYTSSSFPVDILNKPSVSIGIHVEPPEVLQLVNSYDGTLSWAIDNYRERQRLVRKGSTDLHWSPYFYTSPIGHKVQVQMSGNGQSLRTDLIFLNRECFPIESTRYKWEGTVTFFHPLDPTQQITEVLYNTIEMMNFASLPDVKPIPMITNSEINKVIYNDTLHYRVQIKTNERQ